MQIVLDDFHSVMVIMAKVFFGVYVCVCVFVNPTMTTDSESCPLL